MQPLNRYHLGTLSSTHANAYRPKEIASPFGTFFVLVLDAFLEGRGSFVVQLMPCSRTARPAASVNISRQDATFISLELRSPLIRIDCLALYSCSSVSMCRFRLALIPPIEFCGQLRSNFPDAPSSLRFLLRSGHVTYAVMQPQPQFRS